MKVYNMNICEKTLDNGLHVILVHKPHYHRSLCMLSAPVGGFDLRQSIDGKLYTHRSGCAHYLEHQMFRLGGKDVSEEFARMQASTNAFTSFNKTAYYFQTTADLYEPLQLLFDFVTTLDIDTESVEKEKGIILSEYDMYDQQPESRLFKETWRSLYHEHPIRIDVLGSQSDIQSMEVDDLKKFYTYNYDPSRLTFIGITGKDIDGLMQWMEKKVASLPSTKHEISRNIKPEKDTVLRESYSFEMDISIPYVCVAFKLPCETDVVTALRRDQAMQMVLDSLMSPLNADFQDWMDQEIFTQVCGAECDLSVDHSYVLFYAQTRKPEAYIQLIERLVLDLTQAFTNDAYTALKSRLIASNMRGLDDFEGLALDFLEARIAGYDYWEYLNMSKSMTKEEVENIVKSVSFENKTVTTICPKKSIY